MVKESKLLSEGQADNLKGLLDDLDPAYWIDRSVHAINQGLEGKVGSYKSVGYRSLPKHLRELMLSFAPVKDLPCNEVLANKYVEGDFIPPHIDNGGAAYCVLLSLDETGQGLSTPDGLIKDKKGWSKEIPMDMLHWIEPVTTPRYTVIYLYNRSF